MMPPLRQKWTQKDLRDYLMQNGWNEHEIPAGDLPQSLKYATLVPESKRRICENSPM